MAPLPVLLLLVLSSISTLSVAYTWNFVNPPQQCSNLTVSLAGSGGVAPYRILVLPFGPTPLTNSLEVRRILDVPFPDGETSVSFQLNYPANSQLVAVVRVNFLSLLFHCICISLFLFPVCLCRTSGHRIRAVWSPLDTLGHAPLVVVLRYMMQVVPMPFCSTLHTSPGYPLAQHFNRPLFPFHSSLLHQVKQMPSLVDFSVIDHVVYMIDMAVYPTYMYF